MAKKKELETTEEQKSALDILIDNYKENPDPIALREQLAVIADAVRKNDPRGFRKSRRAAERKLIKQAKKDAKLNKQSIEGE